MKTYQRTFCGLLFVFTACVVCPATAYYNPAAGRWLNRDPIGERGGLNIFAFLGNAPIVSWDVLGLEDGGDTPSACDSCNLSCLGMRCEVSRGPTYTPPGPILREVQPDGSKTASFGLSAEFAHDPTRGVCAGCCELRQKIRWSAGTPPPDHPGFQPPENFSAETFYEDNDGSGGHYGHRDANGIGEYTDDSGNADIKCGSKYSSRDSLRAASTRTGFWEFQLIVIDRCDGDREVAQSPILTVAW